MRVCKLLKNLTVFFMIVFGNTVFAEEDSRELEGISVIGNRELPQALVIVPWKAPEPGDLDGRPINSLIDEVLGPIDRDVHKRKVSYYEQYY